VAGFVEIVEFAANAGVYGRGAIFEEVHFAAEEGLFVERYIISSWAEYVRQRSRMTVADRHIQQEIEKYQREGVAVRVSRFLGVDLPDARLQQLQK